MSRQFIVQTLICGNCSHCIANPLFPHTWLHCDVHRTAIREDDPFCSAFNGLPLLEVGRTPKRLVDTGSSYLVR